MHKLILIGPLPIPGKLYYGEAIYFQMLSEAIKEKNIPHAVVNLSSEKTLPNTGISAAKLREYLGIFINYFDRAFAGKKTVYTPLARSRVGFIRDCIIIWFAWLNGHKIITHVHGGNYDIFYLHQSPFWQFLIRQTILKINTIIVLGEKLRLMYDFEPRLLEKITVIPCAIDLKNYSYIKAKRITSGESIRLLYLSNLIESKGYLDVLAAVKILVKEHKIPIICDFCGSFMTNSDDSKITSVEQAEQIFKEFVRDNNLSENINYQGLVFGDKKIEVLKQAHFFLLPTNYNTEAQPISIIEAMAFGNVVISTNYRAIPDLVEDKKTGFLVSYNQPEAIASVILQSIQDPEKYTQMSEAAINRFQTYFTKEAHLQRIVPVLTQFFS